MVASWSDLRPIFGSNMVGRGQATLDVVRSGGFIEPRFCPVTLTDPSLPDVRATVEVMCDALHLGSPGDSVRVIVSNTTAQQIADVLDLRLLTAKLADARDAQAERQIEPQFLATPGAPSTVQAMEDHSRGITEAAGAAVFMSDVGKHWIVSPRLSNPTSLRLGKKTAINYGGHTNAKPTKQGTPGPKPAATGGRAVWQEPGTFHDVSHVDESQTFVAMRPHVIIEQGGVASVATADMLALHPTLHRLLSHDGPTLMRHPWIAPCLSLSDGGGCPGQPPRGAPPASGGAAPARRRRFAAAGGVVAVCLALAYAGWRWRP
jgi:hypothetical protein